MPLDLILQKYSWYSAFVIFILITSIDRIHEILSPTRPRLQRGCHGGRLQRPSTLIPRSAMMPSLLSSKKHPRIFYLSRIVSYLCGAKPQKPIICLYRKRNIITNYRGQARCCKCRNTWLKDRKLLQAARYNFTKLYPFYTWLYLFYTLLYLLYTLFIHG